MKETNKTKISQRYTMRTNQRNDTNDKLTDGRESENWSSRRKYTKRKKYKILKQITKKLKVELLELDHKGHKLLKTEVLNENEKKGNLGRLIRTDCRKPPI